MTNIAIRVENRSRRYHIGAAQQRPDTLRDVSFEACPERGRRMLAVGDAAKEGRTVLFVSRGVAAGQEV